MIGWPVGVAGGACTRITWEMASLFEAEHLCGSPKTACFSSGLSILYKKGRGQPRPLLQVAKQAPT